MFFSYTVDNFVNNVQIFLFRDGNEKWCGFVAPKLAEKDQNRLWSMYGNQDDAKHSVAAAVKKTDCSKQLTCKNDTATSKNLL